MINPATYRNNPAGGVPWAGIGLLAAAGFVVYKLVQNHAVSLQGLGLSSLASNITATVAGVPGAVATALGQPQFSATHNLIGGQALMVPKLDASGNPVKDKDGNIIMVSNYGAEQLANGVPPVGFDPNAPYYSLGFDHTLDKSVTFQGGDVLVPMAAGRVQGSHPLSGSGCPSGFRCAGDPISMLPVAVQNGLGQWTDAYGNFIST